MQWNDKKYVQWRLQRNELFGKGVKYDEKRIQDKPKNESASASASASSASVRITTAAKTILCRRQKHTHKHTQPSFSSPRGGPAQVAGSERVGRLRTLSPIGQLASGASMQ